MKKEISLKDARFLYNKGGALRDIALKHYEEEELKEPELEIVEHEGNVQISGFIKGNQVNRGAKIRFSQINENVFIAGFQSNKGLKIGELYDPILENGGYEGSQINVGIDILFNQMNHNAYMDGTQFNDNAKIGDDQSNKNLMMRGNQDNSGLWVMGRMIINKDTKYDQGIWYLGEDGSQIEMELVPKE